MAVPDFQSLMLPTLNAISDGQVHHWRDVANSAAASLNLSDDQRREMIPSGKMGRFDNRIHWVKAYFTMAGLVTSPSRGHMQLTPLGAETLKRNLPRIDIHFLETIPGFVEARHAKRSKDNGEPAPATDTADVANVTPEEMLERGFADLRAALATELLARIMARPPKFFEELVVQLMLKLGYGGSREDAGKALGRSGDGGVDGLIEDDKLGLDVVYLQAKRWKDPVGPATVREFLGALDQHGAKKGVLITTSRFTKDAAMPLMRSDKRISLVDGTKLAELMIDHDIGVTTIETYQIKRVDSDYFDESD